jgi:hypothetical protein
MLMSRRQTPIDPALPETLAARYWRSASAARARDLEHLAVFGALVQGISALVHALQKERGASSIFLGSDGLQFGDRLPGVVADSRACEARVREDLLHLDERLEPASCGARFCARIALAAAGLDALPAGRERVATRSLAPQAAIKIFTDLIALLLRVGFEAADIAADAETSRALVALVNFAQGKEYAGQERATAGAALSRGSIDVADLRLLRALAAAQTRSFKTFADFAEPAQLAAWLELEATHAIAGFETLRADLTEFGAKIFNTKVPGAEVPAAEVSADLWYAVTTRRIDAMRDLEERVAAELKTLCAAKIAEAQAALRRPATPTQETFPLGAPVAMLVAHLGAEPVGAGFVETDGWYGVGAGLPKPLHSILDVVEAQSRRIDDIRTQLESARSALAERKTVERAKGILMRSRRLSEKDAYTLLRQTAMGQNKRMVEVAEAVISMADMFSA